jgi:hypothetical protein
MFNSSELIAQVRDAVREYDESPITDASIINRLNLAYTFSYNALIKQNDSLYSRWRYITIRANISTYNLPQDIYNRRIERLFTPVPIVNPSQPITWSEVERCEPVDIPKFQSKQVSVYYPIRWTQMDDKVIVAPTPNTSSILRFMVTKPLIPMAKVQGQIMGIEGNKLILDKSPEADMAQAVSTTGKNLLAISDECSGHVKALYPFSEINGTDVTLSENFNRSAIKGKKIRKAYRVVPATRIDYNPTTKECFILLNAPVSTYIKVGDTLELLRVAGGKFNIVEHVENPDDFYNQPEYELSSSTFSKVGKVTAVGANFIRWSDPEVSPDFVNGYPAGYSDGTYNGSIISALGGSISGNPVVLFNTALPHRLPTDRIFKLNIVGTGTSLDGVQKVMATTTTQFAVLAPSMTGTFVPGTWSMYQYSSLVVTTGWPEIYDVSPGTPKMDLLQLFSGTAATYEALPYPGEDYIDEDDLIGDGVTAYYDHKNDIKIGDWVTLGYTTAVPYHCDLLAELMIFYVSLTLKSGLNESDPEMLAILKEKVNELKSDTDGRNLNIRMETQPYRGNAITSRGRR